MAWTTREKVIAKAKAAQGRSRSSYVRGGIPWCCYFVKYTMYSAGCTSFPNTGSCPYAWGKLKKYNKSKSKASGGDIVFFDWNRNGTPDHIGICIGKKGSSLITMEGNTSPNTSKVQRKTRSTGIVWRVVSPPYKQSKTSKKSTTTTTKSSTTNSSSSKSSGNSSSKSTTKVVYKELYITKPTNTTYTKEKAYISDAAKLTMTNRLSLVLKDWQKIQKLYPNDAVVATEINKINTIYNINENDLYSQYINMYNFLVSQLILYTASTGTCYFITGTAKDLRICQKVVKENFTTELTGLYFSYISDEWTELFNLISLKKDTMKYYIEMQPKYMSPLLSSDYKNNRYNDMISIYYTKMNELYNKMNEYSTKHMSSFNIADKLNLVNQNISNYQTQINQIMKTITNNYNDYNTLQKELKNNQQYLENLNTIKNNFKQNHFSDIYTYWNINVIQNPNNLSFWLDFLSNNFKSFQTQNIGIRTYVDNNDNFNAIYYKNIPQIIYYSDTTIKKNKTGYNYLYYSNLDLLFKNSSQGISAKDIMDDLLYEHSYCIEEINLNTIPIFSLQPNMKILLYDENTCINNKYLIDKISLSLGYNSTMSITGTKAEQRLY